MNAICSRGDLESPPEAGGCYDTKVKLIQAKLLEDFVETNLVTFQVTDYSMAMGLKAVAESGPTHQVYSTHSLSFTLSLTLSLYLSLSHSLTLSLSLSLTHTIHTCIIVPQ